VSFLNSPPVAFQPHPVKNDSKYFVCLPEGSSLYTLTGFFFCLENLYFSLGRAPCGLLLAFVRSGGNIPPPPRPFMAHPFSPPLLKFFDSLVLRLSANLEIFSPPTDPFLSFLLRSPLTFLAEGHAHNIRVCIFPRKEPQLIMPPTRLSPSCFFDLFFS